MIDFKDIIGNNPDEIKIEGFSSLESLFLSFESLNQVILTNLFALKRLELDLERPINSELMFKLIENLSYIETLVLHGKLSYFNLDRLSNLKELELSYTIKDYFNFHLFDNLCNQLESISFSCIYFDDQCLEKLFYDRNFPYLTTFYLNYSLSKITLEKKFFDGLRMLQNLIIFHVQIFDNDVFSNLIELQELWLKDSFIEFKDNSLFSNLVNLKKLTLYKCEIESIRENSFSNLHNLEYLDMSSNRLRSLSAKSFVGLDNLKRLDLRNNELVNFDLGIFDNIGKIENINLYKNPIINKDEILNRSAKTRIKVKLS